MEKRQDVLAILKLYELRRDEKMREARSWFFSEFSPKNAMDIIALFRHGEKASAYYRMVTSFWDMAASFVLNGAIDEKLFTEANGEQILVYAKIGPFLPEIREIFKEPDYLEHLEKLVLKAPNAEAKIEGRRRLIALWSPEAVAR